jgi:type II secretory pathway pseudopilin PulG
VKKTFTLLELLLIISLLGFLYTAFIPKTQINKIDELTNRLVLYLKQTRYQSFIDDKYSNSDDYWHKKRWTLKFFRCRKSVGGIYYSIYSDRNSSGHPSIDDSLKDSLTLKNIYSTNHCKENINNSKYVLLTKNFNIKSVAISCNETTALGQLSFGSDGKIYSRLSNIPNDSDSFEIMNHCRIKLTDNMDEERNIVLESNTGYIYKE